jgi:tight adherence protein C
MQFVATYPEFFIATMFGVALIFRAVLDGTSQLSKTLRDAAKSIVYLMPERYLAWLQRNQTWAGWRSGTAFSTLASVKVYASMIIGFVLGMVHPAIGIAVALIVFFIPDAVVASRRFARQREVLTSLPQALDLLVLCVDAGLGLDSALHKVAGEQSVLSEALGEELAALNRDILLGMDRERAYDDLFVRTGVDELRTVGSALAQSGKLGLSIGQVIRAQSEFIRTRQHQRAEERASKLSIWMVFPLWFCIMPALMIILLAPPLFLFFKNVSHFPPEWFM